MELIQTLTNEHALTGTIQSVHIYLDTKTAKYVVMDTEGFRAFDTSCLQYAISEALEELGLFKH